MGTVLGTVPTVLAFVYLGSSGLNVFYTGDVLPLVGALALTGILVAGSTWYRRHHTSPARAVEVLGLSKPQNSSNPDSQDG